MTGTRVLHHLAEPDERLSGIGLREEYAVGNQARISINQILVNKSKKNL